MHIRFVVIPLFYIGVMHCTYLQLISTEWGPLQSSAYLVQVLQTCNIYTHFVDDVDILRLFRQFLVSLTWTSFCFDQTFELQNFSHDLTYFFKNQVFQVCGICSGGEFHYRIASSCSQKEIHNLIFFSLFLVVFQFLHSLQNIITTY